MNGMKIILTLVILSILTVALPAYAGGGVENVLIVVNERSSESLEIGNSYRRAWKIPYTQVLRINTATGTSISYPNYLEDIEKPIRAYLKALAETNQVTTIVLTRGIPVVVNAENGRSITSLLAALDLADGARETERINNPFYKSPIAFQHQTEAWRGM
ncbi:MAG: TIGR03790 family protein, partial [bacterium]